ncbi:hypothetical protein BG842_06280 [Haladaptatus sp. W1]|uniref:hypothetical protein n=1 Tax=Haladaptatus sp. W1 TaxID=1897478 RepID=UPI0008498BD5|nr:hypothetical protein [Haladaptatus sp. W1]ODR80653.1 hypothetical protein BG842_06280 [Haladaptatus sp. W1]
MHDEVVRGSVFVRPPLAVSLLSIGVHFLLGTGLTDGNATLAQIVLVWLFAVGAVAVAFRKTVIEQLRA